MAVEVRQEKIRRKCLVDFEVFLLLPPDILAGLAFFV